MREFRDYVKDERIWGRVKNGGFGEQVENEESYVSKRNLGKKAIKIYLYYD